MTAAYPSNADGVVVWRYHNEPGITTAALALGALGATAGSDSIAVCYMDHLRVAGSGPPGSPAFYTKAVWTIDELNGKANLVVATNNENIAYPPPPLPTAANQEVETYMTLPPGG